MVAGPEEGSAQALLYEGRGRKVPSKAEICATKVEISGLEGENEQQPARHAPVHGDQNCYWTAQPQLVPAALLSHAAIRALSSACVLADIFNSALP